MNRSSRAGRFRAMLERLPITVAILVVVGAILPGSKPAAAADSKAVSEKEKKAVGSWIDVERKRMRPGPGGEPPVEFTEGRLYVVGDVGEDGRDELMAQFTIERGAGWDVYLAVFRRDTLRPLAHGRIGGKSFRAIEIQGVNAGEIVADTENYEYSDDLCCPSVPGTVTFVIENGSIEEHDARFDCSEPTEEPPDASSRV